MAGSDRRGKPWPAREDDIHPPHQRDKRVRREDLVTAIKDEPRSKNTVDKVLAERGYAIDKVRYYADHPDISGAGDREVSATETVILTTEYERNELYRGVEQAAKNKENARRDRPDPLSHEMLLWLTKSPDLSAKDMLRALEQRIGASGSPVLSVDLSVHWIDGSGRRRVTSSKNLGTRLSRLRKKVRQGPR